MYTNNQKWRLIYIYIYIHIICRYIYIYGHIFCKCKIYRSQSEARCETIHFYHNFLQIDYDKFYIFRIYMHTHIYTLCFAVMLALYRIFIIVCYFDILLLYKKYVASRYIFNSVLSIS